ncbi:aromatic acid exporter family protein [Aliibacillus thermotolerans]|uniref:Aromatic acid exporter family protein n=1 Tax=Aliibacillus thermotolerans TaxID=1834418 RepID=A0ABW0U2N5_9BACI|nr:aromatic acid exporter family protein [Aliibacillus thermotolerans]MDA3128468.1 aromatic acid exporter family protein [Aliibacillus thermotolerans]
MRKFQVAGGRVLKTGVAIFLTATICELIGWPPVFAVITAIVTIEPTVSDSIKKGIVRFPASAIGSFYAVLFISLFGHSPLTYTLAAILTIITCYRLHLHAGLLVATLTSVAMVEVIHDNYMIAFFIRLGTTTIGLLVSTVVNMFILPPNYTKEIVQNIRRLSKHTGKAVEKVFRGILREQKEDHHEEKVLLEQLDKTIQQTETFLRFQKDESKFHPLIKSKKQSLDKMDQQLSHLRLIHYHLNNVVNTPLETITWTATEREKIFEAVEQIASSLQTESDVESMAHNEKITELMDLFWEGDEEMMTNQERFPTHFPPELIILYELVSIYQQVTSFFELSSSSR